MCFGDWRLATRSFRLQALHQEGLARPAIEPSFYRNGFKLGQRFGEGAWDDFLDRFEASIHPEIFDTYLHDEHGNEIAHECIGVDLRLLKHLACHEKSLVDFIGKERQGRSDISASSMEGIMASDLCAGLVGPK